MLEQARTRLEGTRYPEYFVASYRIAERALASGDSSAARRVLQAAVAQRARQPIPMRWCSGWGVSSASPDWTKSTLRRGPARRGGLTCSVVPWRRASPTSIRRPCTIGPPHSGREGVVHPLLTPSSLPLTPPGQRQRAHSARQFSLRLVEGGIRAPTSLLLDRRRHSCCLRPVDCRSRCNGERPHPGAEGQATLRYHRDGHLRRSRWRWPVERYRPAIHGRHAIHDLWRPPFGPDEWNSRDPRASWNAWGCSHRRRSSALWAGVLHRCHAVHPSHRQCSPGADRDAGRPDRLRVRVPRPRAGLPVYDLPRGLSSKAPRSV